MGLVRGMATVVYCDTHVLVFLYAQGSAGLSQAAVDSIEQTDRLLISPMVRLELDFLYEIGRLSQPASTVLDHLSAPLPLRICDQPFSVVVEAAQQENWTRDPFDRLIVAQARCLDAALISRDRRIQANYENAFW